MPDPRTRDEVLADPVMKRFLNGAPLEAYGYCTMYEETDKYITAVIDPIISRPPAYEDVVHRDSPDEKAEGVAWVCVGPHAYGDVYISSQQTYCRVCGKSRNAVGLRSPTVSRRARDWDITAKNLPLIFFTDPKCRAIPIDKKKNTYSLHGTVSWWNATAVRRKLQVENTFPQLTSEELHGLWQRPGRFTDEENLKASLDKLLGASGVITASKMAKRKKKEPSAQTNDRPRKVKQASEEESIASSDDHKDDPKDDHEDEPEEDDSNLATDSDIDDDEDDSEDEEGGNDSGDDSGDDEILRFPNTGEAAMKKATM
ncbi:hypothetical protein N0V95_009051 [Ascochyta clinopodiicola]|nr:hypothetical protein N0V95_009051 [Ascochyta clinopodiicola]